MTSSLSGSIIPFISAVLVLDMDGNRVSVKYFEQPSFRVLATQQAFEKKVFHKVHRSAPGPGGQPRADADLTNIDGYNVVFKQVSDVCFYVVGAAAESEVLLHTVLTTIDESVGQLFKGAVHKKILIENLDLLLLTFDEILDSGLILEIDATVIVQRVYLINNSSTSGAGDTNGANLPITEQSFTQALQTAREQLVKSFR